MNILGVGPLEFFLILAIMLIVLGPRDMTETARKTARWIRRIVQSPQWQEMISTTREIREMPKQFVKESGLEEDLREIQRSVQTDQSAINYDPLRTIRPLEAVPTSLPEDSKTHVPETKDTSNPPGGRA